VPYRTNVADKQALPGHGARANFRLPPGAVRRIPRSADCPSGRPKRRLDPIRHIATNPLPSLGDRLDAVKHTFFFENGSTEYSRASMSGRSDEAFAEQLI
jgi:hypothetical protein